MNFNGDRAPAGGTHTWLVDLIRGASWPMVAMSVVVVAVFAAGPRFGLDPVQVLVAVAALTTAGSYAHSRAANKQTNGVLDDRMLLAVQRGITSGLFDDVLRRSVSRGIAEALDGQPPAAVSPSTPMRAADLPAVRRGAGGATYTGGPAVRYPRY